MHETTGNTYSDITYEGSDRSLNFSYVPNSENDYSMSTGVVTWHQ
jgi:hypothetical protein